MSNVLQYMKHLDADQTGGQAVETPGKRMARQLRRGGVFGDDLGFLCELYRSCLYNYPAPKREPTPEEEARANHILPIGWPANNFGMEVKP